MDVEANSDSGLRPELSLLCSMVDADMAQLTVRAGIRTVILDGEHGFPLDVRVQAIVAATRLVGGECLVRVPDFRRTELPPLLDVGVSGVVLSQVQTVESLQDSARLLRFPPIGTRSVNLFVQAAGDPGDGPALEASGTNAPVWAMAETGSLIDDLERLGGDAAAACRGITGFVVGPYDLSAALGCVVSPSDPTLLAAVRLVASRCAETGTKLGIFVRDVATLAQWRAAGIEPDMVIVGYDRDLWFQECLRRATASDNVIARRDERIVASAKQDSGRSD